jgi:hypothetical protein
VCVRVSSSLATAKKEIRNKLQFLMEAKKKESSRENGTIAVGKKNFFFVSVFLRFFGCHGDYF